MRLPPPLQKTLRVLAALAIVAGGVWLLRFAARDLLRPVPPPRAEAPEAQVSVPAEKALDLAKEVPQTLWTTFGGLTPERSEETLPMPVAQARTEVAARLAAKGWKPLSGELPLDQTHLLALAGDEVYATPDNGFAQVSVTEDATTGGSRVRTFLLRTEGAERVDPEAAIQADGLTLLARSAARLRPERRLPRWMGALCQGHALTTRLVQRRGGAAFYLTTLTPGTPEAALARVGDAAATMGWRREPSPVDALRAVGAPTGGTATFIYRNVACNVRATPGPRTGESSLVYRFTDDEVYVRPPRKENP